ncbi:MAG: ABC transporter ATP-binding protein [Desulfurivibrionaceae bacterium]
MEQKENVVEARSLSKQYPRSSRPALNDIDLTVRSGECFGLLGPNGAGKTTAISILAGVLRPDRGEVNLLGNRLSGKSGKFKKDIGLVPQDIALYAEMTGRENLTFFGRLQGLKGRNLDNRIADCLELTGLSGQAERTVDSFSGGMKRRLNLAAALLHSPRLLILDEPTVGIDAQSRQLILDRLVDLRRTGTTLIYTTHYMEEAEQNCDRVAVIDQGRIIATGPPAELEKQAGCADLSELFFHFTGRKLRDD